MVVLFRSGFLLRHQGSLILNYATSVCLRSPFPRNKPSLPPNLNPTAAVHLVVLLFHFLIPFHLLTSSSSPSVLWDQQLMSACPDSLGSRLSSLVDVTRC